jgi:hypothetical protein
LVKGVVLEGREPFVGQFVFIDRIDRFEAGLVNKEWLRDASPISVSIEVGIGGIPVIVVDHSSRPGSVSPLDWLWPTRGSRTSVKGCRENRSIENGKTGAINMVIWELGTYG